MKVSDIASAVEDFAPASIQEGWDNSGLIIGSPEDEVHGVLVGFDCTPELVEEAVGTGCDMIVPHHPLIFKGIRRLNDSDPVGEAILGAVRGGIAVYAAHTNADKVLEGVSGAMARRLSLTGVEILVPEEGGTGLGTVGFLPRPMTASEAVGYVKERFSLSAARTSAPVEGEIRKVALCGGSGADFIGEAARCGAQLYISADISYHRFFAPKGMMIMDIGHFESEIDIVDILYSAIRKKFPNFAVRKSGRMTNPVRYV